MIPQKGLAACRAISEFCHPILFRPEKNSDVPAGERFAVSVKQESTPPPGRYLSHTKADQMCLCVIVLFPVAPSQQGEGTQFQTSRRTQV